MTSPLPNLMVKRRSFHGPAKSKRTSVELPKLTRRTTLDPKALETPRSTRSNQSTALSSFDPADTPHRADEITGEVLKIKASSLARAHHLDEHEVRRIIKYFQRASKNSVGGIEWNSYRDVLCKVFDTADIDDEVVSSAYACASWDTGPFTWTHIGFFLTWYVANMFTHVSALNASPAEHAAHMLLNDLAKQHDLRPETVDEIKRKFDSFDVDKSGCIDQNEFRSMLVVIFKAKSKNDISNERFQKWWQEMDKSTDGQVDFEEFLTWYVKYMTRDANDDDPRCAIEVSPVQALYASYDPMVQRSKFLASCRHTIE